MPSPNVEILSGTLTMRRDDQKFERGGAKPKAASCGKAGSKDKNGEKLKNKDYEERLKKLHIELVQVQEWAKATGAKVCIIFEGRDGAGKGGTIKAITERVSPRVFRVIALAAPTE